MSRIVRSSLVPVIALLFALPFAALPFAALLFGGLPGAARAQGAACPAEMAWLDGFCIDRWEAHLQGQSPYEVPTGGIAASAAGAVPQGYISGVVAQDACAQAGKRLCTNSEWLRACRGRLDHAYPYGDDYVPGACNDTRAVHPVIEVFGPDATFTSEQTNDPQLNQLSDSLDASGANAQCVTPEGVYDLHGNLNEWTSDVSGTFRGGFYVEASLNGPGCSYATTAHGVSYHDFSTGFRCCQDALEPRQYVPSASRTGWLVLMLMLATTGAKAWLVRRSLPAH